MLCECAPWNRLVELRNQHVQDFETQEVVLLQIPCGKLNLPDVIDKAMLVDKQIKKIAAFWLKNGDVPL